MNKFIKRFSAPPARGQDGLASIVVTGVLVALLSVMTVSFSAVMRRELTNSVQNQISQAAFYAAKSGINDAASYINSHPTASVTNCDTLVTGNGALAADSDLSGDGSTAYTCALIDTSPSSLEYQSIGTNTSQVFKGTPSSPMESMMLSWQASDRANNIFVPSAQAGSFYDETNWSANKYAPVLRVSLYPVPANTKDIDYASTNSRTYFLYPTQTGSSTVTEISYSSAANGTVQQVNCGVTNTGGNFNGTADYDCNLIVSNLPSAGPAGYLYYVRVTPIYGRADFKFKGNDNSSNPVDFSQTQALIDVTAQSAGALKRLQARVDISNMSGNGQSISPSDQGFPDFAIQTADALCKRILVPSSASFPVYIDPASSANCSASAISLPQLQPPVTTTGSASPVNYNNATLNGTVNPNNGTVSACYFQYGTTSGYGSQVNCSPMPGSGTSNVGVSAGISVSSNSTYHFRVCATNQAGTNCGGDSSFNTPNPPAPSCSADWNISDNGNGTGNLSWNGSCPGGYYQFLNCNGNLSPYTNGCSWVGGAGGSTVPANQYCGQYRAGADPWGWLVSSANKCITVSSPPLRIDRFISNQVWDEGPQRCINSAPIAKDKQGKWYCRNNPRKVYTPEVGCPDGGHRFMMCGNTISWIASGGVGAITCRESAFDGAGVFISGNGNGPTTRQNNYGWDFNPVASFVLKCTDATGTEVKAPPPGPNP